MVYTLPITGPGVIRDSDGARLVNGAPGWSDYQTWLAAGNSPTPAPPAPSQPIVLTPLQYFALFTSAEQSAILASTDPHVSLYRLEAAAAGTINLSSPIVKAALDYLVTAGLITAARETAILANTPPA